MTLLWTEDRTEDLKRLYQTGVSLARIGNALGKSRNAVAGKVGRLGLPRRGGPEAYFEAKRKAKVATEPQRPKRAKRKCREPYVLRTVEVAALHIPLSDLTESTCRYPYGESNYTFCGLQVLEGFSYCRDHANLCFNGIPTSGKQFVNPRAEWV